MDPVYVDIIQYLSTVKSLQFKILRIVPISLKTEREPRFVWLFPKVGMAKRNRLFQRSAEPSCGNFTKKYLSF